MGFRWRLAIQAGLGLWLGLSSMAVTAVGKSDADCPESYRFGAAQSDITGPIAEAPLNGYGDPGHRANGLHMRLRARAFVVEDPCQSQVVAMVINDLGMIFHNVRESILERLNEQLPGVFSLDNLMLSATHTHAAHGGYGHHILYNVTTLGFSPQSWEAIVAGTTEAIVKAYRQRQPATLRLSRGRLNGTGWNRSLAAYRQNPQSERDRYESATDDEMTVIKAVDQAGRELAVMNWFAVHPVSLPLENKLVSGDNKGLASYKLERQRGTTYQRDGEFVAGFFQANSGDISPYDISEPLRNATDYWQRLNESASRQAAKTEELLKTKGQALQVGLDARHQFVDLHGYEIDSRFTDGVATKTCLAALGVAFAAGTENGQPLPIFKEGTIYGVNWPEITLLPGEQACHEEKVILLPTGKIEGWTPHVLPYQLIRLGELAIVGAPFEITSMAGRRLKQHVQRALAPLGVRYVVLSALTNQYAHYVTTPEEYKTQNYEGGSTLFGPNTLAAHTQQFDRLAQAMVNGTTLDAGPQPANLENQKFQLQPGVVFDSAPRGQDYGAVASPPEPQYQAGDRVEVVFWGAHPKNDLKRGSSYIRVEYMGADGWQPLWFDWDPSTRVVWQRKGLAKSHWQVSWQSEPTAKPGRYRICHEGVAKPLFRGLRPYSGCTQGFELNGSASDVAQSPLGIR